MAGCTSEPCSRRQLRSRRVLAGGLAVAAVVCLTAAAPSKVTSVRFWSLGDVTRVAIEVSSDFHYKSDRLANPDRLFFDIQGARPEMISKGMDVIAVGDPLLKQIRIAETQPGVTRVVLDLEQHSEYTASQLTHPDRLMIELRSKDRPSPPATTSVSGAKQLTGGTTRSGEPDLVLNAEFVSNSALVSNSVSNVEAVRPPPAAAPKPEPRKFEPPPERTFTPASVQSETLAQPSLALTAKPPKPPVSPAWSAAVMKRNLPPPPPPQAPQELASLTLPPPVLVGPKPDAAPIAEPINEALPAKRNTNGDRSLTRVLGLKLGRVVLDPGHGGHDVGTHGPSGLYEKDLVLDVAQRLGKLLEDRLGTEVIYTRNDDTFIPLEARTTIANDHKADLFLSIHANSSPIRYAAGVETYYLNFTTSKTALEVAARENAGSEHSVFDLKDLLQKIALRDKIDESREFATRVQTSLYGLSAKGNAAAKNRGVKKAPFVVLIGASMPSILAEIGFLTNSADEALLRKPEHRQKIAEALFKGISNYADTLSHFQVAKRSD
jgi:N-acetylmuramoyl-L-alanine amidase